MNQIVCPECSQLVHSEKDACTSCGFPFVKLAPHAENRPAIPTAMNPYQRSDDGDAVLAPGIPDRGLLIQASVQISPSRDVIAPKPTSPSTGARNGSSELLVEALPLSPKELWAIRLARYLGAFAPTFAVGAAILLTQEIVGFENVVSLVATVLVLPAVIAWFVGSAALPWIVLGIIGSSADIKYYAPLKEPWIRWRARTWHGAFAEGFVSVLIVGGVWGLAQAVVADPDFSSRPGGRRSHTPGTFNIPKLRDLHDRQEPFPDTTRH